MQESHQPPSESASPGGVSRRSVLAGASAGAAGLALTGLAAAPALAARTSRLAAGASHQEAAPDGDALVVHVRDIRTGEMDVYRGTSHVRVTDRSVATMLARASREG
jgi:hypothetical protein